MRLYNFVALPLVGEARLRSVLLLGCLILFTFSPVKANTAPFALDTITFTNGDHLSGELKSASRDSLQFDGLVTGNVAVKWKDIKKLTLPSAKVWIVNSQNPNGFVANAPVIDVSLQGICVQAESKVIQTFPLADLIVVTVIEHVSPQASPVLEGNHYFRAIGGSLKLSPESIVRATQKQIQFAGDFDIGLVTSNDRAFKHQATNIALEANYSDSRKPGGAAVITELYSGKFQQNVYLIDSNHSCESCTGANDGPYIFGVTDFYHNLSLGMNLAQSYGGGIGWDIDHGRGSYTLAADVRYLGEELYSPGKSLSLAAAGLTEQYSYTFPWHDVTFEERILLIPTLTDSHAFQIRGTTGLDFPVSKNISFDADLLDDYVRNAPPLSLQNFAKVTFSLKYLINYSSKSH